MASNRATAWGFIVFSALATVAFVLIGPMVRGWDKAYQSYNSQTCEDSGVAAAKSQYGDAISESVCLSYGALPFGVGIPCATWTVAGSTQQGVNPQNVTAGTGYTESYTSCGLVQVGTCGFNALGVRACFNKHFMYNPDDPNHPVGYSSIVGTTKQAVNP